MMAFFHLPVMFFALVVVLAPQSAMAQGVHDRGPIRITSDLEFTPVNGVIGGTGTIQDPYMIQGWTVHSTWVPSAPPQLPLVQVRAPVDIRNTTAAFVLRALTVEDPGPFSFGIFLNHVENARIEDTRVAGFATNAMVRDTHGLSISGGTFENATSPDIMPGADFGLGVEIRDSTSVVVRESIFRGNRGGALAARDIINLTIEGNTLQANRPASYRSPIDVYGGSGVVVAKNIVTDNGGPGSWAAIQVINSDDALVSGNMVRDNHVENRGAISIDAVARVAVLQNSIGPDQTGIYNAELEVFAASLAEVRGNKITARDGIGVIMASSADVATSDNEVFSAMGIGMQFADIDEVTSANDRIHAVSYWSNGETAGIFLNENKAAGILNATLDGIEGNGVVLAHSTVVLDGLHAFNNTGSGIAITNTADVTIRRCDLHANGRYGIEVGPHGEQSHIIIESCKYHGNSLGDLRAPAGKGANVTDQSGARESAGFLGVVVIGVLAVGTLTARCRRRRSD